MLSQAEKINVMEHDVEITTTETVKFEFPLNVCETYRLADNIEKEILDAYNFFFNISSNHDDQNILDKLIKLQEKEIEMINSKLKFEVNCQLSLFYESGGTEDIPSIDITELNDVMDFIQQSFYLYSKKTEALKQEISAVLKNGRESATQNTSILISCLELRDIVVDLFNNISDACPDKKISMAMNSVTTIMQHGTIDLCEACIKLV